MLASRFASDTFASDKIGLEMIGRWAGSLGRGRWRRSGVSLPKNARSPSGSSRLRSALPCGR